MKSKIAVAFVALVSMLLVGCASGPAFQEYSTSIQPISPDLGRIFVYRQSAIGAAIQPKVWLNEEVVGKAKPKGFFYVDKQPGSYELSTTTEAKRSLNLTLDAGEEKYVRLEVQIGVFAGHIKPVLVDTAVGMEEIQGTNYIENEEE